MFKKLNSKEISDLDRFYRINLINKISGYKSGNLIGTNSKSGRSNLAVFNSVIHVGANPPYLGFLLRPHTVERHTYENILSTGYFTINQITSEIHKKAHTTSASYPREVSEFKACNLTEWYSKDFPVPFVAESAIKIGLSFVEENAIDCNGTIFIVGKIETLIVPESAISDDGDVRLEELDTVALGGLDTYYTAKKLGRYKFSRPNIDIEEIQ
ncbi:MAG TPA: flavin oxidoreductase [Pricia antarctica]|uniref:Flavin oxidoreductase n=1 Tax=Pricia antarctica TaxID=641691 RepID=A0A831QPW5_9FLAO|nr:flavin oxidoreductase [Pricia antarctica]